MSYFILVPAVICASFTFTTLGLFLLQSKSGNFEAATLEIVDCICLQSPNITDQAWYEIISHQFDKIHPREFERALSTLWGSAGTLRRMAFLALFYDLKSSPNLNLFSRRQLRQFACGSAAISDPEILEIVNAAHSGLELMAKFPKLKETAIYQQFQGEISSVLLRKNDLRKILFNSSLTGMR
jgi:hypothetical protein